MPAILDRLHLTYGQKLFLLASVPLTLSAASIALVVAWQSNAMATREIHALETQLIETKMQELRNYVTQARNGFYFIYGSAAPDDADAKTQVAQILAAMIYGEDGSFFVYDYDGTNLVSPRRTEMIGKDWSGLTDPEGTPITDRLIEIARAGSGYHDYLWPKPSTGEEARMISFVLGFQDWQWAVGTGVWIDDITREIAAARAGVEAQVRHTFLYIGGITLTALLMVSFSGLMMNLRERRLVDAKLKELTQRVFDAQEEERGRVARELHDGISQILVGVKYTLDIARRRLSAGDARAGEALARGQENLSGAIQEVRRISRDLRPGTLDDLGLGPALKALTEEFHTRTGIDTCFDTVVFRNRIDQEGRIALYRIAQEALTNVDRHAGATRVDIDLRGHRRGCTLRIADNGCGIDRDTQDRRGIGLRNMQERMDQLGGALRVLSSREGTVIEAEIPLSHLLPPEGSMPSAWPGT
ncbi:histidine kinase [Salipiger aestuarii]|uniref:histidine kinase n=1 Tax=Salipiger aestuarii TaxID=568098 RepID=A0A327YLL8_9RHOB|nr:cache domain-containing protein [Salipiger aestuarii]KAB2543577.1 histidine kinase [Salipiger aestuarii]RAK21850.1 two-component system NarL family sensor kinase [Salipiger aestuarii]